MKTVVDLTLNPQEDDFYVRVHSVKFWGTDMMIRFTDEKVQFLGPDVNLVYSRETIKTFEAKVFD